VTGETASRLVWLVLASWRGRSIVRDGVVLVILFFVIIEEVSLEFGNVPLDIRKIHPEVFNCTDERRAGLS
jgi:hypothetical protein